MQASACIAENVDEEELQDLAEKARDYMLSHGHLMRIEKNPRSQELVSYAPFNLFPSPLPKACFHEACQVQQDYNLLIHKVAHDYEFLKQCLAKTVEVDDFTMRFWQIYETINKEGKTQKLSLGLNRSDYMADVDGEGLAGIKQLEFNTLAAAGANMACAASRCHQYLLKTNDFADLASAVPDNQALNGLAAGIVAAWKHYDNPKAVVVFLVGIPETNLTVYDQRMLEYAVHNENPEIRIIRKTLTELHSITLEGDDRNLFIDGNEICIVYLRWCYSPRHFTCEKDWDVRLAIERSRAMVCPDIGYHLAGTKKIQQMLAQPGMVERFLADPQAVKRIRATFTGQYTLDKTPEGDAAIQLAMQYPDRYVIKPQREGGGNNTFGEDIPELLKKIKETDERQGYVMMDIIRPPSVMNCPVRAGNPIKAIPMVGELGIFGAFLGDADTVLLNTYCGYLLKSKPKDLKEGGIFSGQAVFDSVLLV